MVIKHCSKFVWDPFKSIPKIQNFNRAHNLFQTDIFAERREPKFELNNEENLNQNLYPYSILTIQLNINPFVCVLWLEILVVIGNITVIFVIILIRYIF